MRSLKSFLILVALLCTGLPALNAQKKGMVDPGATTETKALFKNLQKLSRKHTLFGHHNATEYGHGWSGDKDRSDVKSVCGSHPAVIGIDFSGFSGRPAKAIEKAKEDLRINVIDTYNRGGRNHCYLAF